MTYALNQSFFYAQAHRTLKRIAASLDQQTPSDCDLDEETDRLTLQCDGGIYLINIHETAQQIWVSSPLSGAHHFSYDDVFQRWCSTKDMTLKLDDLINRECSRLLGCSICVNV